MRINLKTPFLLIISSISIGQTWGQAVTIREPKSGRINSPYSRYGIGNVVENKNIGAKGMGGTATGYAKDFTINAFNPASYTFLNRTTLEFAIEAQSNTASKGTDITRSGTFTINQFNLAFPIVRNTVAVNFGYTPLSKVYYNAIDTTKVPNLGLSENVYNGEGNLNFAYVGVAGGAKGFSIGFNVGYLFGNIRNSTYFNIVDSNAFYTRNTDVTRKDVYSGLYWKGGVLYKNTNKKGNYFSVGATATLSQKINTTRTAYMVASTGVVADPANAITDTVYHINEKKGKTTMPAEFTFGAHYGKGNQYDVGFDVTYADWSMFKKFDDASNPGMGKNAYRISLGGEVIPNPKATAKEYFSAITYRMGLYYGKDYFYINNTDINYYGLTIGAQLPLRPYLDQGGGINLSLDFGNRGTLKNNLAKEFYVKFNVGVRFNDLWFRRAKYQ